MSLNALPSFNKRSVLDFLPIDARTTAMQLVSKKWENIMPFEGHLDLNKVSVSDAELVEMIAYFQAKDIKIVSIDLSNSTITDDGLAALASSHFPIQRLQLKACVLLTDEGLKHLAALPLTELGLAGCVERDDGLKHIAECHQLTSLDLSFTPVTDKGLRYISSLALTELNLRGCPGISRFASSFPNLLFPGLPISNHRDAFTKGYPELLPSLRKIDKQKLRQEISKTLPILHPLSEIRTYSMHIDAEFREQIVKDALLPLIEPLPSIQALIAPLHAFTKREMDADPKFSIYFNPATSDNESIAGSYSPWDESIEVFAQNKPKDIDATCLLHELGHKAYRKIGWKTTPNVFLKAKAQVEIDYLKRNNWEGCDPIVARILRGVDMQYPHEKRFEELLVRMPEILTYLAKENPTRSSEWIEKQLKKDIPSLYSIYTKNFLPQLENYNKKGS